MAVDQQVFDILARVGPRTTQRVTPWRDLDAATAPERLAAMLDEIADTILPRCLTFEIGTRHCDIAVSSSRVLKIDAPEAGDQAGEGREARLKAVAAKLAAFAAQDGALRVLVCPLGDPLAADDVGQGARELRAYSIDQGWFEDGSNVDADIAAQDATGVQRASVLASAELTEDGQVAEVAGPAALLPGEDALQLLRQDMETWRETDAAMLAEASWIVMRDLANSGAPAVAVKAGAGATVVQVIAPDGVSTLAASCAAKPAGGDG